MNIFTIKTNSGLEVTLCDFGARIIDIKLAGVSVAVHYSNVGDYARDQCYLGATIGPIANRLEGGSLRIDDQVYQLPANEGRNSLHGGLGAYDKARWEIGNHTQTGIEFVLCVDEQHNPLPGKLDLTAHYHVTDKYLQVDYAAKASHLNYLNISNHVYLNLNSEPRNIQNHQFELFANSFLLADQHGIPTGESIETDCPFNYTTSEPGRYTELNECVDHHFNCTPEPGTKKLTKLVEARSPESNISVTISSNKPGFQFYTGQHLKTPLQPFEGFCVEPQYAPNAPNDSRLYSPYCSSEKPYQHSIRYQFDWPAAG